MAKPSRACRPPDDLWTYYGFKQESGWLQEISEVPKFLARTGVNFEEPVEFLRTRFVNADGAVKIQTESLECDPEAMTLIGADETPLGRMHRFIRLWRKFSWLIADLDRVLHSLSAVDFDSSTLGSLVAVRELESTFRRVPLADIVSLWVDIDTQGEHSLYQRLFRNRAVAKLDDQAAFLLDGDTQDLTKPPLDLADTSQVIDDHVPAALAALGIAESDLATIRSEVDLAANSQDKTRRTSRTFRSCTATPFWPARCGSA